MNAPARHIVPAPPANIEAEQALLGGILVSGDVPFAVTSILDADHFSEPLHQRIYRTAIDMARTGRRPTVVTIRDYLPAEAGAGEAIDVKAYVARLAAEAVSFADMADFARSIVDQAMRRGLSAIGADLQAAAVLADVASPPAAIIADAEARLFALARDGQRQHQRSRFAGLLAEDIVAGLESAEPQSPPISTGFADLDRLIGGYRRGNLIILAGRPGMGKTTLATSSALAVAGRGHPVLFFSLDMPGQELAARMMTDLAYRNSMPIAYEAVLNQARFDPDDMDLLRDAARRLKRTPIVVDQRKGLSVGEIVISARRWADRQAKDGKRPGLMICDHLGKIRTDHRERRDLELGDITNAMVDLAGELDVPVLVLCQLNRQVEAREGHRRRPQLSDLRESGRIEEDAAVVIGAFREAYYLAKAKEEDPDKEQTRVDRLNDIKFDLEAVVLKNRHGAEGTARLWMHAPSGAVRDREWSR